MDDNMPSMRGPDAALILRKRGFSGIICGVTGNISKEDVDHFISSGANFVLPKPLDIEVASLNFSSYLVSSPLLLFLVPLLHFCSLLHRSSLLRLPSHCLSLSVSVSGHSTLTCFNQAMCTLFNPCCLSTVDCSRCHGIVS